MRWVARKLMRKVLGYFLEPFARFANSLPGASVEDCALASVPEAAAESTEDEDAGASSTAAGSCIAARVDFAGASLGSSVDDDDDFAGATFSDTEDFDDGATDDSLVPLTSVAGAVPSAPCFTADATSPFFGGGSSAFEPASVFFSASSAAG